MKNEYIIGAIVEFTKDVESSEIDFSPGMRAKIVSVEDKIDYFAVGFDFSEFEEYNKSISKPVYYDENFKLTLHWHQTKFYPENKIEVIYLIDQPFIYIDDIVLDTAQKLIDLNSKLGFTIKNA